MWGCVGVAVVSKLLKCIRAFKKLRASQPVSQVKSGDAGRGSQGGRWWGWWWVVIVMDAGK